MNLFQAIFTNNPSSIAIVHSGREITYGDLQAETLKTAGAITSLGIRPGDRVALLLHDSPEFIEAFIAICSLGAITVPINMALPVEDQRSILHNSGARLALMEDDIRHTRFARLRGEVRALRHLTFVEEYAHIGAAFQQGCQTLRDGAIGRRIAGEDRRRG